MGRIGDAMTNHVHLKTKDKSYDTTQELAMDREPIEQQALTVREATPMTLLDRAVAQGANIETLDKLMGLQERWEANQARKAYNNAIAEVRAKLPVILKTHQAHNYKHEDLGDIARAVDPVLAEHGLSYRWRTESAGEMVNVTCIISHKDGHSEENTLSDKRDMSGSKNPIHGLGSTVSYLQRYTLKSGLGLAASKDDDAHVAVSTTISEEQVAFFKKLVSDLEADEAKLCGFVDVEKVEDMTEAKLKKATAAVNEWAKAQRAKRA